MTKYDLVVVGAGPGGSIAAKTASEKGLKTLLIERGRKPGEKASSGCGLAPRVWRDFDFIKRMNIPNLKIKYQSLHMLDENLNERFTMRWSPSDLGEYQEARDFFQVNVYRSDLDPFLSRLATEAGAELRTSTLVANVIKDPKGQITGIVTDKGEKIEGDVTIAADGAISLVAYQAGLRGKWKPDEITLVVDCDFEASMQRMEQVVGPEEYGNHVYVSPLYPAAYVAMMPGGLHIGFGQWLGRFVSGSGERPYEYLRQVIQSEPLKRFLAKLGAKPREFHSHLLPWMPRLPTNTYGNGIMLIGDAAGFPCPLEAEGVHYAMLSGKIAAEVAARALSDGDTSAKGLSVYEDRWKNSTIGEEFSAAKEWADLWAGIFFNPPQWKKMTQIANNLMFWASWSNPHITNLRKELSQYSKDLPFLFEFVKSYLMPLSHKSNVPLFRTLMRLGVQWLRTKKRSGMESTEAE
jgi:electron transfer flavoprotein-quinone oxidoreductase